MISTILLPPEDIVYENYMHFKKKSNPYFSFSQNKDMYSQDSMMSNYDQITRSNQNWSNYFADKVHASKSKCRNHNDLV